MPCESKGDLFAEGGKAREIGHVVWIVSVRVVKQVSPPDQLSCSILKTDDVSEEIS